ncbi:MAG: hypothetical protein JWO08_732 [Verrucomicrobiaceae bacterium]|nr:hypothetical protein [Verrucomicrobiaceae bacterium]
MRHLIALLILLGFSLSAYADQNEYIIVSGGPALRKWEDLRRNGEQHDRFWGNFIRTARARIEELQKAQPGIAITWMVYQDAYTRRSIEDKRSVNALVESVRDKFKVKLVWFHSGDEVINYINNGSNRWRTKVSGFEYFGHSNKFCFMFDYSSDVYGVSTSWLHQRDLRRIHSSAFASNAYCHSWGCHTGEAMSAEWKKATGLWMIGASGKTDYTDLELHNNHPHIGAGAHWKTRG